MAAVMISFVSLGGMSAFRTNYGSAFHGECTPSRFSHSIPATDGGSQTAILIAELLGALLVIELWQSVELFGELGKTPEFKLSHLARELNRVAVVGFDRAPWRLARGSGKLDSVIPQ